MVKKYKILYSYDLKIIALITMVIDHIGSIFFPEYIVFRLVGRVAFILYAFMLVEGCFHTSSISKYIKKITFWAIVSEIPYDLAFYNTVFYPQSQNIFFALLLGVVGISFFQKNKNIFLNIVVLITSVSLAYFLKIDYSWYGVLLIYSFYFLKEYPIFKLVYIQLISIIASFSLFSIQIFAFLGFLPISLYNGKLGQKIGNIYYSFYAIHLLFFYFINIYL